jgi:hypothetical protein
LQTKTSSQNDSDSAPNTLDDLANHQANPAASAPLQLDDLPHDRKVELWRSKLVKSGKQTQIQEDNKLGAFDIQHIMDKYIKPGLFLARLERDLSKPESANIGGFILVPFNTESATKVQHGTATKTVKLGLVSHPPHLQKAMESCFQLLKSNTQVTVRLMINKKPKKTKEDKLSVDMLGQNPHAWPDVIAKCMPKGTVFLDAMINHEEGVVSWIMEHCTGKHQKKEKGSISL